jgi:hypothetical protein
VVYVQYPSPSLHVKYKKRGSTVSVRGFRTARQQRWTLYIHTFTSRYPKGPASDGALRLTAAAAHIGVHLVPYGVPGTRPAESDCKTYEAVSKGFLAFVSSQTGKADEALEAPPAEVGSVAFSPQPSGTARGRAERRAGRKRDGEGSAPERLPLRWGLTAEAAQVN